MKGGVSMTDFKTITSIETSQEDLAKISFMAEEIMHKSCFSNEDQDTKAFFLNEREAINILSVMILDYTEKANNRLQSIIEELHKN